MDFLEEEYKEIIDIFKSETEEHLDKINQSLVNLEKNPADNFLIDNIFREAHSLKGSARMLGFNDIQSLAHQLESVISQVKNKILRINPQIIDLLYENTDCIRLIVDKSIQTKGEYSNPAIQIILKKFDELLTKGKIITEDYKLDPEEEIEIKITKKEHKAEKAEPVKEIKVEEKEEDSENDKLKVLFTQINQTIEQMKGKDIEALHTEFLPVLDNAIPYVENNHVKEVCVNIRKIIEAANEYNYTVDKDFYENIKTAIELLSTSIFEDTIEKESLSLYSKRLQILYEMIEIYARDNDSSQKNVVYKKREPQVQAHKPPEIAAIDDVLSPNETWAIKTLRVDTRKLDSLVNQSGELIVAKIKSKEHIVHLEEILINVEEWYKSWNKNKRYLKYFDRKLISETEKSNVEVKLYNRSMYNFIEENTDKIVDIMKKIQSLYHIIQEDDTRFSLVINDLENLIKSIRVLPLATIFHMLPRMVRDIARDRNKDIELIVSGSETSADKKIIEEIKSPLIHIIRNSADHGIETREERIALGKDPVGKINLSAKHVDNNIIIEITDDGRGIDVEKIKQRVLEKKILSPDELDAMTPHQIMNIIFWPGFTTEREVTEISGRGIGLDIVHTKISQLNGKVNITSELGKRCTVQIQLPVTMATLKSFLIETSSRFFAIPASYIKTAFWVRKEEIFTKENCMHIIHKDRTIPVFYLDEVLNIDKNRDEKSSSVIIIVVQEKENEVGFIVEKLLGEQEILHKGLPAPLVKVPNVSGITTLGSGDLCLILNGSELIKTAFDEGVQPASEKIKEKAVLRDKQYKILIAEDSLTTGILQKNILKAAGYDVDIAKDGFDALNKILGPIEYDLLVTDIEMPGINGIDLTKKIRNELNRDLPIILVSSTNFIKDELQLMQIGANKFIQKATFDQTDFLDSVEHLLDMYSRNA